MEADGRSAGLERGSAGGLAELKPTAVIPAERDAYAAPRVAQVREALAALTQAGVTFEVLDAEDFRRLP